MFEGESRCHVCASVVADDGESLVSERPHQPDDVVRHRALCVRGDLRRFAVPAQVGANDPVMGREAGSHHVPGRVRAWVPVQEHHGWAVAAVPDAQRRTGAPSTR